jgi:uncharacterized protein YecA (UPF0149 family)
MPDPMSERFNKKLKQKQMDENDKRARTVEDIKAEEELLKKTKKVDPIKAEKTPDRNDPCPCGSGKKYKKCCGA